MKWYLILDLVCISLMTNDIEHFFMAIYWPFANLWRNVSSDLLPIFKLGYLFFFFYCCEVRVLYMFCIQIHYVGLQVFSPILWVVFSLSWYAFETQKF